MLGRFKQGLDNGIWWDAGALHNELRAARPDWTAARWANGITQARDDLKASIAKWRDKRLPNRFPRFRRRKHEVACSFPVATCRVEGRRVRIPKLGWVRMREPVRFDGKLVHRVTVRREADKWRVAFTVDTQTAPIPKRGRHVVGVDVGVKALAVTSDGAEYANPKPLDRALKALRGVNKAISRSIQVHGRNRSSNRRNNLYAKRRRIYARIEGIRANAHRQAASAIAKSADAVVLETLRVKNLLRNRRLSRALSDAALGAFLSEMAWQCKKRGVRLVEADTFYPSTKTCSDCGALKPMRLDERTYACADCGLALDRDYNAALNLRGVGMTALRGDEGKSSVIAPLAPVREARTRLVQLDLFSFGQT